MAEGPLQPVIRRIRRLVGDEDLAALGDGLLLKRFAADRDEAAFTELSQDVPAELRNGSAGATLPGRGAGVERAT